MAIEIFYFSGTGNSLAVARAIAASTGGAAISIPDVLRKPRILTQADTIGVVYPAYLAHLYGVPLIVERFILRLENIRSTHLFAVCTCGGYEIVNAVPCLKRFARLAKSVGGKLFAQYSVRLPMNNLSYDHIPVPIEMNSEAIIRNSEARISDISKRVLSRRSDKNHFLKAAFNFTMTPMYRALGRSVVNSLKGFAKEPVECKLGYRELVPLTDRSIQVDEKCNGCAACAKACPAQNIEIVDGKPVWQHRCEMCFACDEWCPQNAVHHWGRPDGTKYHHPGVTVRDMYEAVHG